MSRLFKIIYASLFILFTACEDKDTDKIYKAQVCLDTATSATVDSCLTDIANSTSSQAFLLKCSADFLRANITESTLVAALESINNSQGNTANPTVTAMSNLKFGSNELAATAVTNCTATGSSSLSTLAAIASVSTATFVALQRLGLNGINANSTPEQIAAAITALNPSSLTPTELAAVGTSVISLADSACGATGSFHGTEVCNAIPAGADPATVATAFLNNLDNITNPAR